MLRLHLLRGHWVIAFDGQKKVAEGNDLMTRSTMTAQHNDQWCDANIYS